MRNQTVWMRGRLVGSEAGAEGGEEAEECFGMVGKE